MSHSTRSFALASDGLPPHVVRCINATGLERHDMVHNIPGTRPWSSRSLGTGVAAGSRAEPRGRA